MSFEGFVRERLENVKKFLSWLVFEFKQKLPYPELGTYTLLPTRAASLDEFFPAAQWKENRWLVE